MHSNRRLPSSACPPGRTSIWCHHLLPLMPRRHGGCPPLTWASVMRWVAAAAGGMGTPGFNRCRSVLAVPSGSTRTWRDHRTRTGRGGWEQMSHWYGVRPRYVATWVVRQARAAAGPSCIHERSTSQHHRRLDCYRGKLTEVMLRYAVILPHRGKLHNAVALGVEACGLQIESHQGSCKLQAACRMSYQDSLSRLNDRSAAASAECVAPSHSRTSPRTT
jgi:hypothetical protein